MIAPPRRGPIALALALAACAGGGDPVRGMLDELVAAAEARDADAIRERLSPAFSTASGSDRDETHRALKRLMLGYETASLELLEVLVEREGTAAEIVCTVAFSGRARPIGGLGGLLPPGAVYRFELEAAEESGTWRLTRAAWQPVERPAE